jgi:Ca2+-binding EF-hand superfamily protein
LLFDTSSASLTNVSRLVSTSSAVVQYENVVAQPKNEEVRKEADTTSHQIDTIALDECDLQVPVPESESTCQSTNRQEEGITLSPEQEEQILNAFRLFDTNDSGFLDVHEMHSALFALGYLSDYRDDLAASIKLVNELLTPGNDSEGVSKERFRDIMRGSLIEKGGLEEICMTFDAIVNIQSLQTFAGLTGNGVSVESFSAGSTYEPADENMAASTEPTAGMPAAPAATNNSRAKNNVHRGVFPMSAGVSRGADSTVGITFEKLRRACHRFDVRLNDEELRRVIRETDRNRNGYVDKLEYIHVLKHSCWF